MQVTTQNITKTNFKEQFSPEQLAIFKNRKRSSRISANVRKARKLRLVLQDYLINQAGELSPLETNYLLNLRRNLGECGSHSLYRQHNSGSVEFMAAKTCKHKLCPVCNAESKRLLLSKYLKYFQGDIVDQKTGEIFKRQDFDYFHLTLTVPHTEGNGWRGKQFYATELMASFNLMRKRPLWQKMVFAGEFGVEVTKNTNGLHIHIHSLLVVRKSPQNRNFLHQFILSDWNRNTVDPGANRTQFTPDQIAAIKKGNKLITDADIAKLNPQGSTLISLESLYFKDKFDKKHYITENDDIDRFLKGIMETMKYHFEPASLDKKTGFYDFNLLREILPGIKGKPLYRKFGNWHNEKSLNINHRGERETIQEAIALHGKPEVIDPKNLNKSLGYDYVIVNAKNIHHNFNKSNPSQYLTPTIGPNAKVIHTTATNLVDALLDMIYLSIESQKEAKKMQSYQLRPPIPFELNDLEFFNQ